MMTGLTLEIIHSQHFMWVNDVSRRMHDADFARWERQHTTDVYHFVTWTWGIAGWKSAIFEVEDGKDSCLAMK